MAAAPPKGWRVEYAKSGRATCKSCDNLITKDSLRIAKIIQSTQFDGFMPVWHHSKCILSKPGRIKSLDDVEGVDDIRWEDNQKLRKYVEKGDTKEKSKEDDDNDVQEVGTGDFAVEVAKSARSTCKKCNEKIPKGEVRISTLVNSVYGAKTPAWRHAKCFLGLGWWMRPLEELPGWDSLSTEDQERTQALVAAAATKSRPGANGSKRKVGTLEEDSVPVSGGKKSTKRKADEGPLAEKKSKGSAEKDEDNLPSKSSDGKSDDLQKKLEKQSKEIWALKDELKKNVTLADYRAMLAANAMDVSGTEQTLRDRCVDGMLFGALSDCPVCKSPVEYREGQYKCKGFLTAWSKCNYATLTPKRKAGKWKIPSDIDNGFLVQWKKKQTDKKEERLLLPPAPSKPVLKSTPNIQPRKPSSKSTSTGPLGGLSVAIVGRLAMSQANWKKKIEEAGGIVSNVAEGTDCIITRESEVEKQKEKLQQAQTLNIPIVKESYLLDCIDKQARLPFEGYTIGGLNQPAMVKVKVKGRSAVHEDSGLQDTGHILEDGKVIYNVTLSLSDLSTGINSYYILQIVQDDHKKVYHLFRKWGRVGNTKIGGQKVEQLGRTKAIAEFRRLFQEKTGNSWLAWETHEDLEKQPGKFYPVDIDFGVSEEMPMKALVPAGSKSKLDPRVVNLMKLLCDIETYRAALMEFEINLSEMPLGKLSKRHIERGFQVLTEIQNLISGRDSAKKENLLVDASNRFFTLIPSVQPNIIRDRELLKSKIEMLESLRDIEIASQLIGSVGDSDEDPIDVHYRKLHCGISPLPHDSDDYKLVKKYLERTHAPTHKDWELELEDVFEVDREGEYNAYAPYKEKLENRMLLWHGSRTTNYVGILSQGLRIAPPEAPVTGYMFGKGLYFADLVSKSAQYCFTSKKSPTGLLLLCEVALGKTKEFKQSNYMEKPVPGTNSTKGAGKTVPLESEFDIWDDNVIVPCGRPVSNGPSDSNLLYNEYIVYDTAQVHLRFLLKVHFKHKR